MKRLGRLMSLLLLISVMTFAVMTWLASSHLICPARRGLQDYHREILGHAAEHGMRIEAFATGQAPCLMCEPVAQPGAAVKGNKVRAELQAAGVALHPWGKTRGTLVLLHGHNGCKEDLLPVAERFCAVGFRCLLVDLPGHGQNPAPFSCFGQNERPLPYEVLHTAGRKFGFRSAPAGLFGISQGGAIALQAAARPGEPWAAVGELSSFATLDQVVTQQARNYFGPLALMAEGVVTRLVQWRAGYTPAAVRPIDAVAKVAVPVLIGHGDADGFVTPDQARALFRAVPSTAKEFLAIPGAGHGNVLVTKAPVYAKLSRFFLGTVAR